MKNAIETLNFEEFFAENGAQAISAVTGMMASQQNVALGLTKLVLEHCVENIRCGLIPASLRALI